MASTLRRPAIRFAIAFLVILLLGVQPNWTPLLDDLQVARAASGLSTEALDAILDAYARQPWHAERARSAALAVLAAGDYESAKTTINAAAALGGWTPELHIALGEAHSGTGDTDKAIAEWEAARPDRLTDPYLLTNLAVAYEAKGRYSEAAGALRTLVTLQPDNAVARYRFGVVLAVVDPASAPAHLALAAGMDPSVEPFADSLNQAVEVGLETGSTAYLYGIIGYTLIGLREYAPARAALTKAVEARPDFAEAHAYLGLAEDYLGNDGMYAYQRALSIDDQLAVTHYLVGLHYRRAHDNDRAIPELNRAFELDPTSAAAAAELGSAYTELADLPTAEAWYVQAVSVAPEDASFWILLAKFYLDHDLKIEQDGLLAAQKAVELAPDSAEAWDTLGFGQYLHGDFTAAEQSIVKAGEIEPQLASIHFHLGLIYLDTNRPLEAKQSLETAVALDAGGPIAELAIRALARLGVTAGPTPMPAAP